MSLIIMDIMYLMDTTVNEIGLGWHTNQYLMNSHTLSLVTYPLSIRVRGSRGPYRTRCVYAVCGE